MREKPRYRGRLEHMLQAIVNIEEFLQDKSAEDFLLDKMLYFAVVKNMEIIGEAAYMLTSEFKTAHPATDWRAMTKMRHILVHGYYQVDSSIVWVAIRNDLPVLRQQLLSYLQENDFVPPEV